ncbi:MAG: TspO/MBR family protein [archaeon]|jgi:tryptophan-rich sensory protein
MKDYLKFIISMAACLGAAVIGSLFTQTGPGSWYTTINQPPITPPNIVFPIVWTTLFILMGLSLYLIWSQPHKYRKDPEKKVHTMMWFYAQLIVNILWSMFFFGLHSPVAALMCIFVLDGLVAITVIKFYGLHEKAAYLLMPYLIWICFATILNFWIAILN